MRWGDWYLHDAATLRNVRTGTFVGLETLSTPATTDEWLFSRLGVEPELSLADGLHLHIAANVLVWQAFDYSGMGDWVGQDGVQMGAVDGGA